VRRLRQWWACQLLLRDLRIDMTLHDNSGFRQAFPVKHVHDFYCSNVDCMVKHHIY